MENYVVGSMRFFLNIFFIFFVFATSALSEEADYELLAKTERIVLSKCVSDSLTVIERHKLGRKLFEVWEIIEATCGAEIDQVKSAVERGLKDEMYKKIVPGQYILSMAKNAEEALSKRPVMPCAGAGCSLTEYRACLTRKISAAIKARLKPLAFEKRARNECEDSESSLRSVLAGDFGAVQQHYSAGGLNHRMNDAIHKIIGEAYRSVVVIYAEDLVKVQPERKSCKPEMCGAFACISLSEKPSEYDCAMNQK